MKKTLLLALSLTAAAFSAQAQTAAPVAAGSVAGPAITFEESKYDFGSVAQGGTVTHVFKFKNTGKAPLIVSNIGTSCGCTIPEWTKDPIAPGKTGSITAHFNSTGKFGMQNKVLTVESNATAGSATVSLVGEVKEAAAAATSAAPAARAETLTAAVPAQEAGRKVKEKASDTKSKSKIK